MVGIHAEVAPLREVGLVARPLDVLLPEPVGGLELGLELLPYRQRDVDADWRQAREHELADRAVDLGARQSLADQGGLRDALTLTHVLGPETAMPGMVAHGHASATASTEDKPLQERGTFPRGTVAAVVAAGLGVCAQLALIPFKVLPGQVPGMGLWEKGMPLLARPRLDHAAAVHRLPRATAPVHEHPGIPGIVQDAEHLAVLELAPDDLA
jgi:hypothetical protein